MMDATVKNFTDKSIRLAYIRLLAAKKGIRTLKELASRLGVSYQHFYSVIIGQRDSKALKRRLIELLGDEVRVLFENKEVGDD